MTAINLKEIMIIYIKREDHTPVFSVEVKTVDELIGLIYEFS